MQPSSAFRLTPARLALQCPPVSALSAALRCSAQRFSADSGILPSGEFILTPSALMSNRTASRSEITCRNLASGNVFQFSGTDLYFFGASALLLSEAITADVVTGSLVFKWCVSFLTFGKPLPISVPGHNSDFLQSAFCKGRSKECAKRMKEQTPRSI